MAENCATTRGAGNNRAYEDAVNTRIDGDLQEVESDLPEDIRDRALSVFRAAISDKATVQQAIEKVQKEALVEVEMERDLVQQLQEQLIQAVVAVDQDIFVVVQIQELVDLVDQKVLVQWICWALKVRKMTWM